FIKNESLLRVWQERSDNGLSGTWRRVGSGYLVDEVTEGPLVFEDNMKEGLVHVFLDAYTTARGYVPFQTNDINSGRWTRSSA
ncbi:hypothetical protein MPER_14680, partial [Moniliophthora perniciosa FA553]